jgi:hypothetical protein
MRQLVELGLAGGSGAVLGGGNPLTDPQSAINAALVYGAIRGGRAGLGAVDQRVATQVARLLTTNDPRQIRMGMSMIGRNRAMMDSLRLTSTALARGASVQLEPQRQRAAPFASQ